MCAFCRNSNGFLKKHMLGYGNIFGGDTLFCSEKYIPITEEDRLALLALLCWDMFFCLGSFNRRWHPRWEDLACQAVICIQCRHVHTDLLQSGCILLNLSVVLEKPEGRCNSDRCEMSA